MADIKVRIEVNPNAESDYPERLGSINNVNAEISNVSFKTNSDNIFQNIPTSESVGINGISFAQDLVFNGEGNVDNADLRGGVLESEQNPTEFVWGVVPESKQYSVKLTFSNASNLKDIIVYGNKTTNQFPTRAIIDDTTEIFSDDYRWAINLQTESSTHTIEFTHWNRANYNASLTFISVMMKYFEIDKRSGLKSVESLSQSTGQPKEIYYGVVPSTGSLKVIDVNGDLSDMIKDEILPNSNVKMQIFANGKQVQEHISNDSNYDIEGKEFSANLDNVLSRWENIIIKEHKQNESIYLYYLLANILSECGYETQEIENMCSEQIVYYNGIVGSVKDYLLAIRITSPYYAQTSLRQFVEDVCVVAQLNLYIDNDNKIKFTSARPRMTGNESVISIPAKSQNSLLQVDFLLKNNYTGVNYNLYTSRETLQEVFTLDATFRDESGNLNLGNIGDNVKIITDSYGEQYLCFFKEVTSSSNMFMFDNVYSKYSVHPVQTTVSSYDGGVANISSVIGLGSSDLLIDEYNFESYAKATILTKYSRLNSETIAFKIALHNNEDDVDRSNLKIKLFARCFNRENTLANIGNNKNVYEYNYNNYLLSQSTEYLDSNIYEWLNIYDIIIQNIIDDYSNGIRSARITVSCLDYYNIKGNKVKDWSKGEVLQVGDIVRIDKDNKGNSAVKRKDDSVVYFKVVGRNFHNEGVPLIDLELMEITANPISNIDLVKVEFIVNGNKYVEYVVKGGNVSIPITPKKEGYEFYGWSIDGETTTSVVLENVQEDATYTALFWKYDTEIANDLLGVMVDNGELMFINFADVMKSNGYNIDWNRSNLKYVLRGTYNINNAETDLFVLNQLTYGSSFLIQGLSFEKSIFKFTTINSCKIYCDTNYNINFENNDFKVRVTNTYESEFNVIGNYQIRLSSSKLFLITP